MPQPFALSDEPRLILNASDVERLPCRFHTCEDAYQPNTLLTREGLESLPLSGSAQFSQSELKAILKRVLRRPLFIVDLRQEFHGFLNGNAVSWFAEKNWINCGKSIDEIARQEKLLLQHLKGMKQASLFHIQRKSSEGGILQSTKNLTFVDEVLEEWEVAEKAGVNYLRLYVTDHRAPSREELERFITFYRDLPSSSWLHIHCAGGAGRTTALMAIVDMLHNAKKVSFDDIIARQHALGGSNLALKRDPLDWKAPFATERLEFLKQFYAQAQS